MKKHTIVTIKDDRDRVRKRPTIYIPDTKLSGVVHIIFEIIDNAIDELRASAKEGGVVTASFDTSTRVCTVVDNGNGIPHKGLLDAITVLNSSGKFDEDDDSYFGMSGGVNGVGLKLSNFLSEWCTVTSNVKGTAITHKFVDGKLTDTENAKMRGHGTTVSFRLDNRFIAIDSSPVKDIVKEIKMRMNEKSFICPNVKLKLHITGDKPENHEYFGKTIVDRVEQWKPDTPIIRITRTKVVKILDDITADELKDKTVGLDVAFSFSEKALDAEDPMEYIIAYGNIIKNYTGGTHVEGLKLGIIKYFQKNVIPKLNKTDKDLQILPSDISAGLCAFMIASVMDPIFRGQYKDQLMNSEVKFAVRDMVYEYLCEQKPSTLTPMIDFVKRVTRGRLASKKSRKKDVSNTFSKDRIDKFTDVVYTIDTVDPELVLLEGSSAKGGAAVARDPYNQALYEVKRPKNIFDDPVEQVAKITSTFNNILDICGIEPGKKCDPTKSTMNRILILTDGDVDGDDIGISIVGLLAKHCRPLIDAGMVGRILPPAYMIPINGKKTYVRSQREFFDTIIKVFIKKAKISHNGKELSKAQLRSLLEKNFTYDTVLDAFASKFCRDVKLAEHLAWFYHGDNTTQRKSYWSPKLKQYSDWLTILLEHGMLVLDGKMPNSDDYINTAMDPLFHKNIMKVKEVQKRNNAITGYSVNGVEGTLYDVLHAMRKFIPKDVERFKGLGELSNEEMTVHCMDKNSRTVVIFKFDDYETEMDKISIIMSTKSVYANQRSELLMNMTIDDIDLDT